MNHININRKFHEKLQSLKSRKAKHQCMYPKCDNKTVNSHTISNKSSLSKIAENGKLISPQSLRSDREKTKDIRFKEIGVNQATTFHGFCIDHEAVFSSIDLNGITTIRDLFLQIYRYSCKEIFLRKVERISDIEALGHEFMTDSNFENSKYINASKISEIFYDLLIDFPEAETEIKALPDYKEYIIFEPFSNICDIDIRIFYKYIEFICPVALQNIITLRKNNKIYDCFIILLPNDTGADLIIVSHNDDMMQFLNSLHTNIDILCFIESFMMLDGEWWLSPSVTKNWSDEKIRFIENDFWCFHEREFLALYDVSLFDELRLELCKDLPEDRLNVELKKINILPEREPIEERKRKYRDGWIDYKVNAMFDSIGIKRN